MGNFNLRDTDNLAQASTEPDANAYLVLVDPSDPSHTLQLSWSLLRSWFAAATTVAPDGPASEPLAPNRIFVGEIGGIRGIWACDGERWLRAPVSEGDWAENPPVDEFARTSNERIGSLEISSGQSTLSHVYDAPFPDGSDVIVFVTMHNTSEDLSKPFLSAMVTESDNAGFTAKFSAAAASGNYNLAYRAVKIP